MSIADKIIRLQTAKDVIKTAITAKGGTVGDNDGFEEFATAIGSIPSGGSLPHDAVIGTFTPQSSGVEQVENILSIEELGFTPSFFMLLATNTPTMAGRLVFSSFFKGPFGYFARWSGSCTSIGKTTTSSTETTDLSVVNMRVGIENGFIAYKGSLASFLDVNIEYIWLAIPPLGD